MSADKLAEALREIKACAGNPELVWAKASLALAAHKSDRALAALTAEQSRLGMYDEAEKQEPIGWAVTGINRIMDEHDAVAEAKRCGGTARAYKLYASPQPDRLDAERLDYLQRGVTVELFARPHGEVGIGMEFRVGGLWASMNTDIRKAIDAAKEAKP